MSHLILAIGSPSLLSISTQPPIRINLPLTPPTKLYKTLLSNLPNPIPKTIHVAEPPICFPPSTRNSISHLANSLSLNCIFHTTWQCVNAILPCTLVLDVTRQFVVIYNAVHVEISERSPTAIVDILQTMLNRADVFDRANARIAVVGQFGISEIRHVKLEWTRIGARGRLRFVGCEFDNEVLVWVGAAVLAAHATAVDDMAK